METSTDIRSDEPKSGSKVGRWIFLGLSVLLAGPVLWVTYPPMADLPQHAAQISILLDWNDVQPPRSDTYQVDLFTPYLLAYGLTWLLAQVLPLQWALKLTIAASLVAFPWSVGRLLQRVGGPSELRWLAFPIALSYSFHWGFLNFLLATPLAVLFFELCVVHGGRPTRRSGAWIAFGSVGLFGCHAILGGLAGLVGGGLVALRQWPNRWGRLALALAPFTAPLLFLAPWMAGLGSDLPADGHDFVWNLGLHRVGDSLTQLTGWDSSPMHLSLGVALLLLPFFFKVSPSREVWRWWPFAACTCLCLFWPELFLTTSRVYGRFAVFLLPLLLFACNRGDDKRRAPATAVSATLAALLLLAQAANTFSWQQQTETFRAMLAEMPPSRSALAFIFLAGNRVSPTPVNASLVHWYIVEKDGVRVDPALIDRFPFVVRYQDETIPDLPPGFSWRVHEFDWQRHGGERYDLFVVLAPRDVGSRLFPQGRTRPLGRAGQWFLYEKVDDAAGPAEPRASDSVDSSDD